MEFNRVIRGRPVRNGVTMPEPNSECGKAWDLCYELHAQGMIVTGPLAVGLGEQRKLNKGNVRTELSSWRLFNGLR